MGTWIVNMAGVEELPSEPAGIDFGPRLLSEQNGVRFDDFEAVHGPRGTNLQLAFTVSADSEAEAVEMTFAWLEDVCRNGTWIQEAGMTVDFDSEDGSADFDDIHDMFFPNGVTEVEDD